MSRWSSALVTVCLALSLGLVARAEQVDDPPPARLRIRFTHPLPSETKPGFQGGTVAIDDEGLWVAERVPGVLIRTDLDGRPKATLSLHPGLGQLVLDPEHDTLFVADRAGDRVLRIASEGGQPAIADELEVREPYGLALGADGKTLLVTSVADHQLLVIDTTKLEIRARVNLRSEPRGVAISPDGRRAAVGFLSSGSLAEIDLDGGGVRWHALDPRDQVAMVKDKFDDEVEVAALEEANSRFEVPNDIGRRHARNVFAVAFVGDSFVAPHQVATPQMERRPRAERRDSYGGGAEDVRPIIYQLARVDPPAKLGASAPSIIPLVVEQPRALAWDSQRNLLYVGGYGDDFVESIPNSSHGAGGVGWRARVDEGCGIDGLAPTPDGAGVWVHCELTRSLVRIGFDDEGELRKSRDWLRSGELAASTRSAAVDLGADLFRRNGDARISGDGMLACTNCHPEGRTDGLTWRLGNSILQTPMLAGRVVDTAPYKWDGQDPELRDSIRHTVDRLGGDALQLRRSEVAAFEAYLLSLPPPRPPTVHDEMSVATGKRLFEQECAGCHAGERTTDQNQHPLTTSLAMVDTPSLTGLAHTAPYYHDGSAVDLETLLLDRATIHDMTDTSALSEQDRRALILYLESL